LPYCPYCGAPTKETDKYCIICGKPLLTDVSKKQKEESEKKKEVVEEPKKNEKEEISSEDEVEEISEVEDLETDKKKKKSKKNESEEDKFKDIEIEPLPDDVKQKIEFYIDYSDLQINKDALMNKLDDITKLMKEERYEYDFDYKNEVNIKFEAVKTLIKEIKEKEKDLKEKTGETFIVQKLNNQIDAKEFQLRNLTREYRLKKIDKDTFAKLKDKYKKEKRELEEQRYHLTEGIKLWIQDLKMELSDLSGQRKINKGRYSAKEISEEEYKKIDEDFNFKMEKLEKKIEILEKLSKT